MSHQVLARKWRPANFREMVGQEHVLRALVNALDRDRLHHAYLFTGTRGVGKTTIARIFARCLNCEKGVTSAPCGKCSACREINEGRFIDLIEVDAASRTKVEDTRELMENVQYAPTRGRYKVYLIDEVHMLSTHSFNALLKTLEEPPPHVKFLLATTDPQKLPATILSRCLQFNLKNMSADRIVEHLQYVLGEEDIECEEPALWLLAEAARGSMRDALSLTDQAIGFGAGRLLEQDVRSMLGTIDRQSVVRLLAAVVAGDGEALFGEIEHLASMGTDFQSLLDELLNLLHAVAVAQAVPGVASEHGSDTRQLGEFARSLSGEDIQIFYQMALNGRRDFPFVPDPRRGFEMVALRLLTFRPVQEADVAAEAPPGAAAPSAGITGTSRGEEAGAKKSEAPAAGGAESVAPASTVAVERSSYRPTRPGQPSAAIPPEPVPLRRTGTRPADAVPEQTPVGCAAGTAPPVPAAPLESEAAITLAGLEPAQWNQLFPRLDMTGVARNIAANTVLVSVVGNRLCFLLDSTQSTLYNDEQKKRLQNALGAYFEEPVELELTLDESPGETPALYRRRCRAERQQAAVVELERDKNVRLLCEQFGGRLDLESVRALD